MTGPEALGIIIYKAAGSALGAILALVFIIPKTRAEGLRRLVISLICGVVFEHVVRGYFAWSADPENVIAAASSAAFVSWWIMGAVVTFSKAWRGPADSK